MYKSTIPAHAHIAPVQTADRVIKPVLILLFPTSKCDDGDGARVRPRRSSSTTPPEVRSICGRFSLVRIPLLCFTCLTFISSASCFAHLGNPHHHEGPDRQKGEAGGLWDI